MMVSPLSTCLLYTSDAADDLLCVDLGGRRIIKKKKKIHTIKIDDKKVQTKYIMDHDITIELARRIRS